MHKDVICTKFSETQYSTMTCMENINGFLCKSSLKIKTTFVTQTNERWKGVQKTCSYYIVCQIIPEIQSGMQSFDNDLLGPE